MLQTVSVHLCIPQDFVCSGDDGLAPAGGMIRRSCSRLTANVLCSVDSRPHYVDQISSSIVSHPGHIFIFCKKLHGFGGGGLV